MIPSSGSEIIDLERQDETKDNHIINISSWDQANNVNAPK